MNHFSLNTHLDLLSSQGLQFSLLSDGENVGQDIWASSDDHFEVIPVFLDLRDALDVFTFLDEVIRKTCDRTLVSNRSEMSEDISALKTFNHSPIAFMKASKFSWHSSWNFPEKDMMAERQGRASAGYLSLLYHQTAGDQCLTTGNFN